jgi:hypothetical protein
MGNWTPSIVPDGRSQTVYLVREAASFWPSIFAARASNRISCAELVARGGWRHEERFRADIISSRYLRRWPMKDPLLKDSLIGEEWHFVRSRPSGAVAIPRSVRTRLANPRPLAMITASC